MQAFNFHIPTRILFGKGKITDLNNELPDSAEKIMIITDRGLFEHTGIIPAILGLLKNRDVEVYFDIDENPTLHSVSIGGEAAREFGADFILGIGGGSAMDAAKGIANHDKSLIPLACIPTTSGTGSEVTPYAVFTDPENEAKLGFSDDNYFPEFSIIDPELTYSMPEQLILNTGLDSLAHAAEAYLSTESFDLNDQIALQSIGLVINHLPSAVNKVKSAMDTMAYSAMLSGIAITHASTILPHIMGYPLTVYHAVPHGRAGIILLPALLDFLKEKKACPDKLKILEDTVGGLRNFLRQLGVPVHLKAYGVTENELKNYVRKTIVKGDVAITPGSINENIILDLYRKSM